MDKLKLSLCRKESPSDLVLKSNTKLEGDIKRYNERKKEIESEIARLAIIARETRSTENLRKEIGKAIVEKKKLLDDLEAGMAQVAEVNQAVQQRGAAAEICDNIDAQTRTLKKLSKQTSSERLEKCLSKKSELLNMKIDMKKLFIGSHQDGFNREQQLTPQQEQEAVEHAKNDYTIVENILRQLDLPAFRLTNATCGTKNWSTQTEPDLSAIQSSSATNPKAEKDGNSINRSISHHNTHIAVDNGVQPTYHHQGSCTSSISRLCQVPRTNGQKSDSTIPDLSNSGIYSMPSPLPIDEDDGNKASYNGSRLVPLARRHQSIEKHMPTDISNQIENLAEADQMSVSQINSQKSSDWSKSKSHSVASSVISADLHAPDRRISSECAPMISDGKRVSLDSSQASKTSSKLGANGSITAPSVPGGQNDIEQIPNANTALLNKEIDCCVTTKPTDGKSNSITKNGHLTARGLPSMNTGGDLAENRRTCKIFLSFDQTDI